MILSDVPITTATADAEALALFVVSHFVVLLHNCTVGRSDTDLRTVLGYSLLVVTVHCRILFVVCCE